MQVENGRRRKERVLLIAPQPFFLSRGTPINVRAMVTVLGEAGYEVDLLAYPYGETIEIPGVRIIRSPRVPGIRSVAIGPSWSKIALDVFLALHALKLCATRRYAVLHGIEEGGVIAGTLAMVLRRPFIFDMDSYMVEQLQESGFIKNRVLLGLIFVLERFFICRADAVLTVCSALTRKAMELNPRGMVAQIEDFPMDAELPSDPVLAQQLREELKLSGRRVLLYTGNLELYQGLNLLLESFAKVFRDGQKDIRLVIVGGGETNSPRFNELRDFARELQIEEQVVFTGSRPPEEMPTFMALADALASPRIVGVNTPLKLYSYMASGRPVVATRIESHTQVMSDTSAFLASPEPDAYAEAIKAALSITPEGKQEQSRRAANALELVRTRYSRKEFSRRLRELYSTITGCAKWEGETATALASEVKGNKTVSQSVA